MALARKIGIQDIQHPKYSLKIREWFKWRLTWTTGPQYIEHYLKPFSKREAGPEFQARKEITYIPAFAKAAVREVIDSIYQRMIDVTRVGGENTYRAACAGNEGGVDLLGNSMNTFIGQRVLPELLVMGVVGVYVDMPQVDAQTKADVLGSKDRPYVYLYEAEDIRSWTLDDSASPNEFKSILLRDYVYTYDQDTGLPMGQTTRFKHFWIDDNGVVYCQFYDKEGGFTDQWGGSGSEMSPQKLGIDRIPFVVFDINDSLMTDIANYQIALLNIASSDLAYILKANYPFYVEQYEPRATSPHLRQAGDSGTNSTDATKKEVGTGIGQGRQYPIGANQPAFINPSSEPIKLSMEKQEQIKQEIRLLLRLAISNLAPAATSAEAKGFDERSLEAGLAAIAAVLQFGENRIAEYWKLYMEGKDGQAAQVKYPEKYNLKSDEDRLNDAKQTSALIPAVPSKTFRQWMQVKVAEIMLDNRIPLDQMEKVFAEIKAAKGFSSDSNELQQDLQNGLVSLDTASELRGYPAGDVEKAKTEHAERIARIAQSQTPGQGAGAAANPDARGVPDASPNPGTGGSKEKADAKDNTKRETPRDPTRGPAKRKK